MAKAATGSAESYSDSADHSFADLGVSEALQRTLQGLRLTSPMPIQQATIPDMLADADVLAQAPTGSGKTVAFGVPLVQQLAGAASKPGTPRALVIAPTRELAEQIAEVLADLSVAAGLRVKALIGGENLQVQRRLMAAPIDIAVVTPGRAHELRKLRLLSLDQVEYVVVDEADQLVQLGFFPETIGLVRSCGHARRWLFSATLTDEVTQLMEKRQPVRHQVEASPVQLSAMRHVALRVPDNEQADRVLEWIASRKNQLVIFANTKVRAAAIFEQLSAFDISVEVLHGDRGQTARRQALSDFARGKAHVLVATDVAARGIDIDQLDLVVHADPPLDGATYVHRSGRTARAGRTGTVVTLVRDRQVDAVAQMWDSIELDDVEFHPVGTTGSLRDTLSELTGARPPRKRRAVTNDRTSGTSGARGASRTARSKPKSRPHRPKPKRAKRKKNR